MNKIIPVSFFLLVSSCTQQENGLAILTKGHLSIIDTTQRQYINNKAACRVVATFLNDYINEGNLDSVLVIDEVRDWKIEENLEYSFNGESWLPKTEKERQQKLKLLNEPLENSYPYIYAYAYPVTDRLFSKADREYIKAQASKNMQDIHCIETEKIKLVDKESRGKYYLSFATPLFTKDSSKVILNVYHEAFFYKEAGHMGCMQYICYEREKDGNFRQIFKTKIHRLFPD